MSSLALTPVDHHECSSYDSKFSKMMIFLNAEQAHRVSKIYNEIVSECTQNGCRNHLTDLHLGLYEFFQQKGLTLHGLAAYARGYYFSQAAKSMPHALGIEQNEYATSSLMPIGSASVGECMCICLRNLKSEEIFVAHIDRRTSKESIKDVLADFLTAPSIGYLIGGSVEDEELAEISKQNLDKVKESLSEHKEIVLMVEKTLEVPHPTAFVFDLEGNLHENVYPGQLTVERMARNGLAAKSGTRPITKLQSRQSSTFSPIKITEEEAEFAKNELSSLRSSPTCSPNRSPTPLHLLELESVTLFADDRSETPEKIESIQKLLLGCLFDCESKT
jgi:hypothetical protein